MTHVSSPVPRPQPSLHMRNNNLMWRSIFICLLFLSLKFTIIQFVVSSQMKQTIPSKSIWEASGEGTKHFVYCWWRSSCFFFFFWLNHKLQFSYKTTNSLAIPGSSVFDYKAIERERKLCNVRNWAINLKNELFEVKKKA